jgi:hypothetical protein
MMAPLTVATVELEDGTLANLQIDTLSNRLIVEYTEPGKPPAKAALSFSGAIAAILAGAKEAGK